MVSLSEMVPLSRLIEQLDELEARPREAWSPRASVQHQSIEHRIVERVLAKDAPATAQIACDVEVEVRARGRDTRGTLSVLEPGGLRLDVEGAWAPGTPLQLVAGEARIGATVSEHDGDGVRIAFLKPRTESAVLRLQAFVREALRGRAKPRLDS